MDQAPVVVAGATGRQGRAVARLLLEKGQKVRAFVRDPHTPAAQSLATAGAELTKGSFDDLSSLTQAFEGAKAVFAMSIFETGVEAEVAQGKAIADAARATGVPHLVFSSVIWADRGTGIPHFDSKFEIEQHIQGIGVPHTILGPSFFMENISSPFMLESMKQDTYALPLNPEKEQPMIATDDIAAFAVAAIENPDRFLGRRVDLAGDVIRGHRIVQTLSQVLERKIRYYQVPIEAVRQQSSDLAIMFEFFNNTSNAFDTGALRKEYPEMQWHSFEQWARGYDWRAVGL